MRSHRTLVGRGVALAVLLGCARTTPAPQLIAEAPIDLARYAAVPVTVGSADSLWFILDTGAGGSVVSPATRALLPAAESR